MQREFEQRLGQVERDSSRAFESLEDKIKSSHQLQRKNQREYFGKLLKQTDEVEDNLRIEIHNILEKKMQGAEKRSSSAQPIYPDQNFHLQELRQTMERLEKQRSEDLRHISNFSKSYF